MKTRTRIATLLLAWLVIIPIGVLVPSQVADAAPEDDTTVTALFADRDNPVDDIEFGQRLSAGSALGGAVLPLPTHWEVARPDFEIWPGENLNQVVNLESFLYISDGFESATWCWCFWFFTAVFRATPVGSVFEFREQDTGATDEVICVGPGQPWIPGITNPFCGKDWEHSSDVTGQVDAEARVLHIIVVTGSINLIYPAQSRASDSKTLTVGEVLNVGQTIAVPVVSAPDVTAESGFCSYWGISVLCWVGEQAAEAALAVIYEVFPFLEEVAKFFDGCADAVINAAGGLVDIIRELRDAISNPREFVDEKLQEFRDLIAAIEADPEGFAKDVLGEVLQLDRLDEEGVANWLGSLICTLAIDYFTGKLGATVLVKARQWLRNRNNPDGPDRPNDNDNGDNDNDNDNDDDDNPVPPCQRRSSFPGDTQVLMGDGTYRRIDAIRPGDTVVSHNIDTSVWEPAAVLDQWSHLDRGPPATATLSNGSTITATDDHLFWRPTTLEWVELQHVQPGDELLTPNGHVTVAAVVLGDAQDWTVWELDVAPNHNFLVAAGEHDLLVHNIDCPPDGYGGRTLEELLPDGRIPTGADYADWWNDLTPEELDWLMEDSDFANAIKREIREGGLHEWCMCSRVQRFKEWGLTMEQIRDFTTTTGDVRGRTTPRFDPDGNPYGDWAGEPWAHPAPGVPNSAASAAFHRELGKLIDDAGSMDAFRAGLPGLLERWGMSPDALPDFPDP